jgi:hypothetical protein
LHARGDHRECNPRRCLRAGRVEAPESVQSTQFPVAVEAPVTAKNLHCTPGALSEAIAAYAGAVQAAPASAAGALLVLCAELAGAWERGPSAAIAGELRRALGDVAMARGGGPETDEIRARREAKVRQLLAAAAPRTSRTPPEAS